MLADPLLPFRDQPATSAILLDVDGTLAPIAAHPSLSLVPPPTLAIVARLVERFAVVACVSGRPAREAARLVPVAGVGIIGNHGLEALEGERLRYADGVEAWLPIVSAAAQAVTPIASEVGAWVEDKGATLSIHLREAPDPAAARAVLVARAAPLIVAAGLRWRLGRMTLEARPPIAADKGTAMAALLGRHAEVRRSLYAGDDLTDLDGFRVVDVAVAVGSDETPSELLSAASLVVSGPTGLVDLLASLTDSG